jgi:hypothetical protein
MVAAFLSRSPDNVKRRWFGSAAVSLLQEFAVIRGQSDREAPFHFVKFFLTDAADRIHKLHHS